jgi:hypothetical protein
MIVKLLSTAVFIVITTGLGAYGLSVAIGLLDTLIDPAAPKDPQYGMSFMVGVPIGGVLGGTGVCLDATRKDEKKSWSYFLYSRRGKYDSEFRRGVSLCRLSRLESTRIFLDHYIDMVSSAVNCIIGNAGKRNLSAYGEKNGISRITDYEHG